jgi:hypothetical protein
MELADKNANEYRWKVKNNKSTIQLNEIIAFLVIIIF